MKLYRPVTILVGVLFVLAGGLFRLAEPKEVYDGEANRVQKSGVIGQKVMVEDSSFEIIRLRFAKALVGENDDDDDPPQTTDGVFIAIDWEVVGGTKEMPSHDVTLKSAEGTEYEAAGETTGGRSTRPSRGSRRAAPSSSR